MAIQPIPSNAAQVLLSRTQATPAPREPESSEPVAPSSGIAETDGVAASASATEPAAKQAQAPSREQIDQAMTEVKKALAPVARNLQFSVDDETGRTIIKVIDASTNEVIRQMPSEELLAITKAIDSFSGLFVKQKA